MKCIGIKASGHFRVGAHNDTNYHFWTEREAKIYELMKPQMFPKFISENKAEKCGIPTPSPLYTSK